MVISHGQTLWEAEASSQLGLTLRVTASLAQLPRASEGLWSDFGGSLIFAW